MKNLVTFVGLILVAVLSGCAATSSPTAIPVEGSEKLLYSSSPERPAWTMEEPDTVDGVMTFVGLSNRHASEKSARADAKRNATDSVVKWMGTMVKNKFESLSVTYGLESTVIDPTPSSREYEKQLAANMVSRVKVKTWYMEKWQTPTGIGYQMFALAKVPASAIDDTLKDMAKNKAKEAEKKAREAADDQAKAQAEKAVEFWKQMQEEGVTE